YDREDRRREGSPSERDGDQEEDNYDRGGGSNDSYQRSPYMGESLRDSFQRSSPPSYRDSYEGSPPRDRFY
ncbi:hypothetical protein SK128_002003, partial [Halocaridina rubra]